MHDIDSYCDRAKEIRGFKSDRALSEAMGLKGQAVNHWRCRRTWPSDETMVKLARLADLDEATALLHLNSWRSHGKAAAVYLSILKKVSATAATLLILALALPGPARAAEPRPVSAPTVYIMERLRRRAGRVPA